MVQTYPIVRGEGGPVVFYIRATSYADVGRALIAIDSGDRLLYGIPLEIQQERVLDPRLPIFTVARTVAPRHGIDGRLLPA